MIFLNQFWKSRAFISGVCVVIAGILAFGLIPALYRDKAATARIITANVEIPKGTQITDAMLKSAEVGAYGLPSGVITDKSLIIGQYAAVDMMPGDFITLEKVNEFLTDRVTDGVINAGKRLVTVSLPSIASGLASHLEKDDIVTIANYIPEKERNGAEGFRYEPAQVVIYPELREVTVFDVENAKAESADEIRVAGDKNGAAYDPIPKTVTLIVTEEQAEKLIMAEYTGKIHLIFEGRGKNE